MEDRLIRVLVVDHDDQTRDTLKRAVDSDRRMELAGWASDAAEAVRRANAADPDVILLDLEAGMMDGDEAIDTIRRTAPNARIIARTSKREDRERSLNAGADAWHHRADDFLGLAMTIVKLVRDAPPAASSPS